MNELPENKRIAFVIGTGRCGTHSMNLLLNMQEDVVFEHEVCECSWKRNKVCLMNNLVRLYGLLMLNKKTYLAGAIGFYFLPRIERAFQLVNQLKVICLHRPKDEVIDSFLRKAKRSKRNPNRNWFTRINSKHWRAGGYIKPRNYNRFPHFSLPMPEAIGAYYDLYYEKAFKIAAKHPGQFKIYDMRTVLCDEAVQREALRFIGIKPNKIVTNLDIHDLAL